MASATNNYTAGASTTSSYSATNYENTAYDGSFASGTNTINGVTATGNSSAATVVNRYLVKQFLENTAPLLVWDKFAMVKPLPEGNSMTVRFNRMLDFNFDTASNFALTEGVTPSGMKYDLATYDCTIKQYGAFVAYSDMLEMTSVLDVVSAVKDRLSIHAARVLNLIYRDVLLGSANWYNAGAATTATATALSAPSLNDIRAMVKFFKSRNVPKITKQIEGSVKISTTPVRDGYVMFVHPNAEFLYRDITGFVRQELYANTSTVMDGEIGMIEDVRIIVSSVVKEMTTLAQITETGGATVTGTPSDGSDVWYQAVLLGADAYGIVPLAGQTSAQILVSPFKASAQDPLAQRATVAWKAATGAIILDPQRVIVYNHGLS